MKAFLMAALIGFGAHAQFQAVDVNTASKEQLMALPGVGDKLAKRMIAHREKSGPFRQLDDLQAVEGVKPKLLEKLQGKVIFGKAAKAAVASPKKKELTRIEFMAPEPVKAGPSKEDIERLMNAFGNEPSARQVQEQALSYANAHPTQVQSWLARVRQAAWAPKLATSGGRDFDNGQSVREKVGDADILYRRDSSDWRVDVKAEWKLSDLVFNRDELFVARESVRQAGLRERIVEDVTRKYFERRRLQVELALEDNAEAALVLQSQMKIAELTAYLDGYTGGWFSAQLERGHAD
jgi:competence ComEA-like helix-hairpin-helix protein